MPRRYMRGWRRSWYKPSVYSRQKSGRRYFNISFPVENLISLTVPANASYSNVVRTSPWYAPVGTADTDAGRANNACGLVGSVAYRKYCQLYDQVKINSVYFTVSIADTIGQGGIPALRAYTSWDRDLQAGEAVVNSDNLINGPESQVVTFINNSRAKFSRYNAAADLQERTTFCDSTNSYTANQFWVNTQWGIHNAKNVGYSPSMSLVFQTSNTTGTDRTITIQVTGRYSVTFRNPKYGLTADGGAKGAEDESFEEGGETKSAMTEDEKFDEIVKRVVKKMKESDGDVVVVQRETETLPDDDELMSEGSQPEMTKEELLAEIARLKGETK